MSWKSTIRSIEAATRRVQREQERQQRKAQKHAELERKRLLKEYEMEANRLKVELYELEVEALTGIGRSCGDIIDWNSEFEIPAPDPPSPTARNEAYAKRMLVEYKPTLMHKISGKDKKMRDVLKRGILAAQEQDRREHDHAMKDHDQQMQVWEQHRLLAREVLNGNLEVYGEVMKEVGNFDELKEVGTELSFRFSGARKCRVEIDVKDIGVVPDEVMTLTSTGKLSTRKMPTGRKMEIYQDYVCGSQFRMARELQALFPVEFVVANTYCKLLNTATGLQERCCICSVGFPVRQFQEMNFQLVDFSDAMSLFRHEMKFSKRNGFSEVNALNIEDFDLSWIGEDPV